MPGYENVVAVLQELVTLSGICLVVGSNDAVCEAFVDPATMDFRCDGPHVTMENGPWHIHLDLTTVQKLAFVVTPDTMHGSAQLSYSVRLLNTAGAALFRAFFLDMYDADGAIRAERVQCYEALQAHTGGRQIIWCDGAG